MVKVPPPPRSLTVSNYRYDISVKCILPCQVLQTLYNSLIMPHFHYCLLAWGSTIKTGHKLYLLQTKAVRTISNSHYIAHTDPIFRKLHIVKVTDLYICTNNYFTKDTL